MHTTDGVTMPSAAISCSERLAMWLLLHAIIADVPPLSGLDIEYVKGCSHASSSRCLWMGIWFFMPPSIAQTPNDLTNGGWHCTSGKTHVHYSTPTLKVEPELLAPQLFRTGVSQRGGSFTIAQTPTSLRGFMPRVSRLSHFCLEG